MQSEFRQLPSVDSLLLDKRIRDLEEKYSREVVVSLIRQRLDLVRESIRKGQQCPSMDDLVQSIYERGMQLGACTLQPVVNATGVILHTNLGRAPLSEECVEAMRRAAVGYSNLEIDMDSGERGSRQVHVEPLLCQLTGAEAALVVNNNAAAVLLGLAALAEGKDVIVSRGQAVEIGGGFRIPDVMRRSGASLVEVGTTNCTYLADYEYSITSNTAALLRVHSSNFRIVGFTQSVVLQELVALARRYNLMVFDDLGSGCLIDISRYGLDHEPTVQESLAAGADVAFFSGDKLLGGPQAGIIVGKAKLIGKIKGHPLARSSRIDKVRLSGLIATLLHYLREEAETKIPIWRMMSMPLKEITARADYWGDAVKGGARIIDGESVVGGGSLPGGMLPTKLLCIEGSDDIPAQDLALRLRCHEPPVLGRVDKENLLLDPRTVLPEEDTIVYKALGSITIGRDNG
ncbi:MAG: L-seryl-tRNA(Sec) selenium transferase [Chloroflexota bacterium]|nr:L-seryl-tRNA(Sec) selenium transferase [Chloroflexota bacterium]